MMLSIHKIPPNHLTPKVSFGLEMENVRQSDVKQDIGLVFVRMV